LPGATVFRPSGPDGKIPDLDKPDRQVASIPLLNEVSGEPVRQLRGRSLETETFGYAPWVNQW
jgi:hypothetical protein